MSKELSKEERNKINGGMGKGVINKKSFDCKILMSGIINNEKAFVKKECLDEMKGRIIGREGRNKR